jgi:hypothetical protein
MTLPHEKELAHQFGGGVSCRHQPVRHPTMLSRGLGPLADRFGMRLLN